MIATEVRRKSYTALESDREMGRTLSLPESEPTDCEAVDLVLLDIPGWRGLALTMGWDSIHLRSFDDLVANWLVGRDRQDLLKIAKAHTKDVRDGPDFTELVVSWLSQERLERLINLVAEAKYEHPIFPVCYSLGKAFTAVDIAIEHVTSVPVSTDRELSLVPADDADSWSVAESGESNVS